MASSSPSRSVGPVVLGIDVGTTTVKVALVSPATKKVLHSSSRPTKARTTSELGPLGDEQDVHRLLTALQFCVSRAPRELLERVRVVAVCGQMHGVVLWRHGEGWHRNNFGRYETTAQMSALYTWQDGRCSPEFLSTLPPSSGHLPLSTGHGCATLFWLQRHRPDLLANYDRAATVQDLVVAMLTGQEKPLMSTQNAASWGYFNTESGQWDVDMLAAADFPVHLLPEVALAGTESGRLAAEWYGIPAYIPVMVALGDLQCSVFATMETDDDAVLNIGTSAQLSFVMEPGFCPDPAAGDSAAKAKPEQYFPYFDGRYVAVAASLNGGNVLAAFVRTLQQWTHELGLGVPEEKVWERILALGLEDGSAETDLQVVPTLFGERHLPNQRGSVANIDTLNITLGKVSRSVCRGVIANLHSMMPRQRLLDAGVLRIVGCGSALTRNPVLKTEAEAHFHGIPVVYVNGSDAAAGVALYTASKLQA